VGKWNRRKNRNRIDVLSARCVLKAAADQGWKCRAWAKGWNLAAAAKQVENAADKLCLTVVTCAMNPRLSYFWITIRGYSTFMITTQRKICP
jgi:hypothetical protein